MAPRTEEQFKAIRGRSRTLILETALGLFSEQGYRGTSVEQIAKKAGVSKGLIYNYFSSKKEVLTGIFELAMSEMDDLFEQMEGGTPREQLSSLIRIFFQNIRDKKEFWRLMIPIAVQAGFTDIKTMVSQKIYGYYHVLERFLADIGVTDPAGEAKLMGALFDGIAVQYLILDHDYPIDEIEQTLLNKYQDHA